MSIAAAPGECREVQCLVAMLFVDTEKSQRSFREQPVDANLNVRAHVTRERPRGRNQLVRCNAGEMHEERVVGKIESLVAGDFSKLTPDLVHTFIADDRRFSLQ